MPMMEPSNFRKLNYKAKSIVRALHHAGMSSIVHRTEQYLTDNPIATSYKECNLPL